MTEENKVVDPQDSSCNLCNRVMSKSALKRVPIKDMQRAVRHGFNPFDTKGIIMPDLKALYPKLGSDPAQLFNFWRQGVLEDTTDWNLCPDCAEAFFKELDTSAKEVAEPRKRRGKDIAKKWKTYISPAGALLALVCFYLPWARLNLAGKGIGTYSASDNGLTGILWFTFAAELLIIIVSLLFLLQNKYKAAEGIIIACAIVTLIIFSLELIVGIYSAAHAELGGLQWLLFVLVALVLTVLVVLLTRSHLGTARSVVGALAIIGVAAILIRFLQLYYYPDYKDLRELFSTTLLYGAWCTVGGLLVALVGSFFLKEEEETTGYSPPKVKKTKEKKEKPPKKPKEKKEKRQSVWNKVSSGH